MIQINGNQVNFVSHFNDGTQQIRFPQKFNRHNIGPDISFTWYYDRDEELVTLMYLVKYYRATDYLFDNPTYILKMPYLPNARMDRVQEYFSKNDQSNPSEVFTLKFFCEFINSMNFDKVITFDVHSPVALSLLNNCEDWSPDLQIRQVLQNIASTDKNEIVIVVPDLGAYKRYSRLQSIKNLKAISGMKIRDWHTRVITNLTLNSIAGGLNVDEPGFLKGKSVLIIDDIIGTGGTISRVINKLKETSGVENIYIYCSHLENNSDIDNVLYEKLDNGTITKMFTTDSLYRKHHNKIDVYRS